MKWEWTLHTYDISVGEGSSMHHPFCWPLAVIPISFERDRSGSAAAERIPSSPVLSKYNLTCHKLCCFSLYYGSTTEYQPLLDSGFFLLQQQLRGNIACLAAKPRALGGSFHVILFSKWTPTMQLVSIFQRPIL